MGLKITYFVHGTTTDNENHISSGWSDAELSEKGVQQSLELKNQTDLDHFDAVFCSDLKRALNSAKLSFGDTIKIIPDARLRECNYGDYNGQPSAIVEPLQEQHISSPFPQGESYQDIAVRIKSFLDFLQENYSGKHVAIVAHKGPQLALDVLLKNKTWEQAFAEDWRKQKAWQAGWEYEVK